MLSLRIRAPLARLVPAAVLLAVGGFARSAAASGFDSPLIGNGQSSPVARDGAAVHHNPAQLGYIERTQLDLGLGVILGAASYQRDRRGQYQFSDELNFAEPIDPEDIDPSRTGSAEKVRAMPVGPLIDAFVAVPVLADRLTIGAGFYVPYAAILSLPEDGPQRFAAQSVTLISTHTTLSAGVKLHDKISIGAGVSYVLTIMELSKVQDFGGVGAFAEGLAQPPINQENDFGPNAPSTVRELDALARQARIGPALSHGVSFNAGVAVRPTDKLDLALVYQHGSRVRLKGDFTLDMDDELFTQDLAEQGLEFPPLVRGDAEIELSLPKRVTLGAGYQVHPKVSLDGSFSYVFYSDFDVIDITLNSPDLAQPAIGLGASVPQDLVRDWKNTVHGYLNVRARPIEKLIVSGTFGYESGASPDSTVDMASPDGNRLIGGVGVEYAVSDRFSVLGDVRVNGLVPRTVTDSDFDLGNGRYTLVLGAAALHAKIRFGGRGRPAKGRKKGDPSASEAEATSAAESAEAEAIEAAEPSSDADTGVESAGTEPSEAKTPSDDVPPPPPPPPA